MAMFHTAAAASLHTRHSGASARMRAHVWALSIARSARARAFTARSRPSSSFASTASPASFCSFSSSRWYFFSSLNVNEHTQLSVPAQARQLGRACQSFPGAHHASMNVTSLFRADALVRADVLEASASSAATICATMCKG